MKVTQWCDTVTDCRDGSDEKSCPIISKLNVFNTLLICLCVSMIVFCLYATLSFFFPRNPKTAMISVKVPALLHHPPTYSMIPLLTDSMEKLIFNKNKIFFTQLLDYMKLMKMSPELQFQMFKNLKIKIQSLHMNIDSFVIYTYYTQGSNHLTSFLQKMSQPPSTLDTIEFTVKQKLEEYKLLTKIVTVIGVLGSLCLWTWDVLRDIIFCLLLRYHL